MGRVIQIVLAIFFIALTGIIGNGFAVAQTASEEDTIEPASPDQKTGLDAWKKIYKVFSHPRCSNCHVSDGRPRWSGPHYGKTRIHGMNVGGDPDGLLGNPGMQCTTCHMAENSQKLHGPPGNEVWFLAPKEFVWWQKSTREICEQVRDPERNGGRSLLEIEKHIAEDALVGWGWNPGPGREPAPYSAAQTAQFISIWAASGAPCPQSVQ